MKSGESIPKASSSERLNYLNELANVAVDFFTKNKSHLDTEGEITFPYPSTSGVLRIEVEDIAKTIAENPQIREMCKELPRVSVIQNPANLSEFGLVLRKGVDTDG